MEQLTLFLNQSPPRQKIPQISSIEHTEEVMALAGELEKAWSGKFPMTPIQLSIMLMMPIECLRERTRRAPYDELFDFFVFTEKLVRIFLLQGWPSAARRDRDTAVPPEDKISRNSAELEKCRARDGDACLFTMTASPQGCHILPFDANSTGNNLRDLQMTRTAIRGFIGDQSETLLEGLGCTDRAWNMVMLSSQLHRWWSMALFALRWVDMLPVAASDQKKTRPGSSAGTPSVDVVLQLAWLPQQEAGDNTAWRRPIEMSSGEGAAWVAEWMEQIDASRKPHHQAAAATAAETESSSDRRSGGHVAAAMAPSLRPLLSGTTATLRMSMEDAVHMKAMVDIQWACVTIAAMSGAADSHDFLHYDDDIDRPRIVARGDELEGTWATDSEPED